MSQNFERSQKFFAEPESILELINNFEVYKTFLPGCLESKRLLSSSETEVRGLLVFGLLNKTYEFESINQTDGYEVQIKQIKGPQRRKLLPQLFHRRPTQRQQNRQR